MKKIFTKKVDQLSRYFSKFIGVVIFSMFYSNTVAQDDIMGGVNFGSLLRYHMVFTDGSVDANWQGASNGFIGNVAIKGTANKRTSGTVPYKGTIYTDGSNLGQWKDIVDDNTIPKISFNQASSSLNEISLMSGLKSDLEFVFSQINGLSPTPVSGINTSSASSSDLNGLNTQNGTAETFVINITRDFNVSSQIFISGDIEDVFILRWDSDLTRNGYQGEVKFQSGGAIVPLGGLTPGNFVHVAGNINASGGGSTPPLPYPKGPRENNGTGNLIQGASDFRGGGFFTGYWFTTGTPTIFPANGEQPYGKTSSFSNAIFTGGWYSKTTEFSMTSGTSGVYVAPPDEALPVTWLDVSATKFPDGKVIIKWSTASEINNDFFSVEKSADGKQFKSIGSIKGSGNSISISHYLFEDNNSSSGIFYYRIKQTDFNKNYQYSKIVMVNLESPFAEIFVYPNPASNFLTLTWDGDRHENSTVLLTDLSGKIILTKTIPAEIRTFNMSLQSVKKGVYFIQVMTGEDFYSSSITVSK